MRPPTDAPAPATAPASAPAMASRLKLQLRVYSAEELAHSSSQGFYCKMYLGDVPMLDGGGGSGRKSLDASSSSSPPPPNEDLLQLAHRDSAGVDDGEVDGVRVFRTKVAHQQPNKLAPPETIWDEAFEVPMPARSRADAPAILSVRVKSRHLLYSPVVGACAISLVSLRVGERLEQWFPLRKGKKPAGRLRLTLRLALDDAKPRPSSGRRLADGAAKSAAGRPSSGPQTDVVAARAANLEADDAIRRLLERRLREDEERRQRKLSRRASRMEDKLKRQQADAADASDTPLSQVGPPVFEMRTDRWEDAAALAERTLDDVVRGGVKHPPQPPQPVPPLGRPAPVSAPVADSEDAERRVDRKLRRLRRERRRLEALRMQLKKYIPDLAVAAADDSGSDGSDGSDSDSSAASDTDDRPRRSAP